MINVQEIRRNVINVVKNYSDAQVKVRKATSNEPWGPTSTLMSEIADLTYNVVAFSEIMQIIWKRLNDHGKNWRHVYKALVLLEYLIKTGSEKVAQQCRDNLFAIQTLKDFQYFEDNKDQGLSIREKSKLLVNLLKDEEKLKSERAKALKAKECFSQSLSHMGTSVEGSDTIKSSSSFHESIALSEAGPSRNINSELESARPQTVGEEELQLQLALAMSKEEAEQEDRLRKNDDLRLKLALEESEKNGTIKSESRSAVDELLSLNPTPSTSNELALSDPWGAPLNNTSLIPSPPNKNKQSPWGPTSANVNILLDNKENNSFDDPWSSNGTKVPPSNDPWNLNDPSDLTTSTNDPWNLMNESTGNDSLVNKPVNMVSESIRRTPESFLGPNSNLVNLDALVSNKTQTSSPSNNPFAPAAPVSVSNPFQTSKPSQPTINELRAQSSQLGGSPLPGYASGSAALNSLFNSPSVSSPANPMPFVHNTLTGSNLVPTPAPGNNAAWGNFASQQTSPFPPTFSSNATQPNNPFAM